MNSVSLPAWVLGAAAGVAVLLVLLIVLFALGARRESRRRAEAAEASEAQLRERLEMLEKHLTSPERAGTEQGSRRRRRDEKEYVITSLGDEGEQAEAEQVVRRTLTAPAFADAVFRETVVHSAALAHGVRRAFSPEVIYKIRYEMHREVKRARKGRKSEMRQALREYRTRQREAMRDEVSTGSTTGVGVSTSSTSGGGVSTGSTSGGEVSTGATNAGVSTGSTKAINRRDKR